MTGRGLAPHHLDGHISTRTHVLDHLLSVVRQACHSTGAGATGRSRADARCGGNADAKTAQLMDFKADSPIANGGRKWGDTDGVVAEASELPNPTSERHAGRARRPPPRPVEPRRAPRGRPLRACPALGAARSRSAMT